MAHVSSSQILLRVTAAIVGSWVFALGFIGIGVSLLMLSGMPYDTAQTLMFLLGALVLLAAFMGSFAASQVGRVWAVLGGGGAGMTAAAWWLTRTFL